MRNVKQKIFWLWQNAEKVLIVTFFLTFTLNIRKVFLTPYSFLNGRFNEYMTMSFSWADLLMLATIVIYTTKSILRQVINSYYASSGYGKAFKNVSRETFYLIFFLGWMGLSIFWSQYQPTAVYRFFIFVEIMLFAAVAVKSLNNMKWLEMAFFAIILNGMFQSLLGITQFVHNGSLGLRIFGESIIGPNIDGVAKILIGGEKHIRAYGTLPHPNILAGFLLIPLFIIIGSLLSRKLTPLGKRQAKTEPNLPDILNQNIPPAFSPMNEKRRDNVSYETLLGFIPRWALFVVLIITGLGFFLTFSRSAFLGFFIGFLIIFAGAAYIQSPHRTPKNSFGISAASIITLIFITILLLANTSFFSSQSLQERTLYQNVSYETILKHPLAGVGIGQFVASEYQIHPNLESWQYQPVHNIYLLVFSELGIVGLIFFLLWIFSILKWGSSKNRNTGLLRSLLLTKLSICCVILSFLFIAFFDHYFWDITLGTLIFVLPFILIFIFALNSKKCSTDFLGLL